MKIALKQRVIRSWAGHFCHELSEALQDGWIVRIYTQLSTPNSNSGGAGGLGDCVEYVLEKSEIFKANDSQIYEKFHEAWGIFLKRQETEIKSFPCNNCSKSKDCNLDCEKLREYRSVRDMTDGMGWILRFMTPLEEGHFFI